MGGGAAENGGGVGLKLEDLIWVWNLGFVLDHDLHRGIDE